MFVCLVPSKLYAPGSSYAKPLLEKTIGNIPENHFENWEFSINALQHVSKIYQRVFET